MPAGIVVVPASTSALPAGIVVVPASTSVLRTSIIADAHHHVAGGQYRGGVVLGPQSPSTRLRVIRMLRARRYLQT